MRKLTFMCINPQTTFEVKTKLIFSNKNPSPKGDWIPNSDKVTFN